MISLSESNIQSSFFNFGKLGFLWKEEREAHLHWQIFPLYLNVPTLSRMLSGVTSEAKEYRGTYHSHSPPRPAPRLCVPVGLPSSA